MQSKKEIAKTIVQYIITHHINKNKNNEKADCKFVLTISFIACFLKNLKQSKCQHSKITRTDKTPFTALEQELNSFVNERKWTNYNFKSEEK